MSFSWGYVASVRNRFHDCKGFMHPRWSYIDFVNQPYTSTSQIRNICRLIGLNRLNHQPSAKQPLYHYFDPAQEEERKHINPLEGLNYLRGTKSNNQSNLQVCPPTVLICVSGIGSAEKRLRDCIFHFIGFIQEPALPKLREFHHIPRRPPA